MQKRRWAKSDEWISAERERQANARADSYAARVTGRRVRVVSDIDYGAEGVVIGVADGMLRVQIDQTGEVLFFDRAELEAVR